MADTATVNTTSSRRVKTWVSSESRRRTSQISLRLLPEEREKLEEEARRRGLGSTQQLILEHLRSVLSA
ncbi:MAG: hypothetical protein KIH64_002980 [Mycobacterium sp.]|nr:hypothetical protein [Mycobacterium sp.]